MKRVEEDGNWSLMCPAECPGLDTCWGEKVYFRLLRFFLKVYSLMNFILGMRLSGKQREQLKLGTFGTAFSRLRLKLALLTCSLRTPAT